MTTLATKRDFLTLDDLTPEELRETLELARRLKSGEVRDTPLVGKTLIMIFRKHSTRTRVSFEIGMNQLGGDAVFLSDRDSQMGRGESLQDTAKVLSGYGDGLMVRTWGHGELQVFAEHAEIPVINGLTDLVHPCQILTDLLTMVEVFGEVRDRTVAWVGDGNNVANSWLRAARMMDFRIRVACPEGYAPDDDVSEWAAETGHAEFVSDPVQAVEGAHVVVTDTWVSMGQEEEHAIREAAFAPYRVTTELMDRAADDAVFMHCLPAHRGHEVDAEVIDGPRSVVIQEAHNRLHAQKALLVRLLGLTHP